MLSDKIIFTTDLGKQVDATAPVIISASRSTDIPAFYPKMVLQLRSEYHESINLSIH